MYETSFTELKIMIESRMPFSYIGSHIQSHTKRLLFSFCNTTLKATISQTKISMGTLSLAPKMDISRFSETVVSTCESTRRHNQKEQQQSSLPLWEPRISPVHC